MIDDELSRRRLLLGAASLSAVAVAGCVGDDGDDSATDDPQGDDGSETDEMDDTADDSDGEDQASDVDIPAELPIDPEEDDFVDRTGQDVVEVVTRVGEGDEPEWVFDPPFIAVDPGTTIRWVNTDGDFHTVTSIPDLDDREGGGDVFDGEIADEGDEFEWEAEEPGFQNYYCVPHVGFMWGAIAVLDEDGAFPEDVTDDMDEEADDHDDAEEESENEETEDLTTDPDDDDFVDMTDEDVVEVETRFGEGTEPEFIFEPPFVRVSEGATVRWVNTDGVFHTVTSTDSLESRSGGGDEFDETISAEGDEFEWVAEETGRQDYYCSPHASFMYGSVDVV